MKNMESGWAVLMKFTNMRDVKIPVAKQLIDIFSLCDVLKILASFLCSNKPASSHLAQKKIHNK